MCTTPTLKEVRALVSQWRSDKIKTFRVQNKPSFSLRGWVKKRILERKQKIEVREWNRKRRAQAREEVKRYLEWFIGKIHKAYEKKETEVKFFVSGFSQDSDAQVRDKVDRYPPLIMFLCDEAYVEAELQKALGWPFRVSAFKHADSDGDMELGIYWSA